MKTQNFLNSIKLFAVTMLIGFLGINSSFANSGMKEAPKQTIVEIASGDERFSILVEAVVKAELVDALNASGPYTVFAPTNDAFESLFATLGVSGISDLTKDQLTPILLYHVVSGEVLAADVKTGKVPTLNDKSDLNVKVSKKGVSIDGSSKVIITDIMASNGVIHVVDAVLVPSSNDKASASKKSSCN